MTSRIALALLAPIFLVSAVAAAGCARGHAACAPSGSAPAVAAGGRHGVDREEDGAFHYAKPLAAPGTVEIRSVGGAIVAEPSEDGILHVDATKDVEEGGDAADVRIVAVEHEGGVLVCALFKDQGEDACAPGDEDDDAHGGGSGHAHEVRVSTEFSVRVPSGVRFVGQTSNGEITAHDLRAGARMLTMNGAIHARAAGAIDAKTMNGDIEATVTGGHGPFVFETMNGDVSVTLPAAIDADLRASTMRGDIESDFPLSERSSFGPSQASSRLGRGGARVQASTMNGDVAIHSTDDAPRAERDDEGD